MLVNNAGATWGAPLEEHDTQTWARVLDLNVEGVFHTTKFFLPLLRAAGTLEDPAQSDQHRIDRWDPRPCTRDLFVLGVEGGGAPADPPPRAAARAHR